MKCGDKVRLEHNQTGKNLHSSKGKAAPLSQRQEVSGYGDDGMGDRGDDWQLECNEISQYGSTKKQGENITGKDLFFLKHVDSGCYLISERTHSFTQANCGRQCPILNQLELSCISAKPQKTSIFKMDSGFFFPPKDEDIEFDEEAEESASSWGSDEL